MAIVRVVIRFMLSKYCWLTSQYGATSFLPRPIVKERQHLLRSVVVAFLKLAGVLRSQRLSVRVQNDDDRQTKPRWVAILLVDVAVVTLVHIDQQHDIRLPALCGRLVQAF